MDLPSTVLMFSACVFFGLALTLFLLAAHRLRLASDTEIAELELTSVRRAERRKLALEKSLLFRIGLPLAQTIASLLRRMRVNYLVQYVSKPYQRAGYPGGMQDIEVVAMGLVIGVLISIFLAFTFAVFGGPLWAWSALLFIPVGMLVMVSSLKSKTEIRQNDIVRSLPYVLDLLVLILRSGASLNIALRRVVADYSEHPIGEELGQVLAEMDVGSARSVAFRNFAERVDVEDITSLADSIVQAEELGWPLAESLERLADRLNSERILRAQAKAGAAGVYVMLPSTLVLAAAVLLLFGPFIVKAMRGQISL